MDSMKDRIFCLLCGAGQTANYKGFFYTAYAVQLVLDNPQRQILVTKWLYPEVARHFGTTWKAVERLIRNTAVSAWNAAPEYLSELAQYPLTERPTATRFIAILAAACRAGGSAA